MPPVVPCVGIEDDLENNVYKTDQRKEFTKISAELNNNGIAYSRKLTFRVHNTFRPVTYVEKRPCIWKFSSIDQSRGTGNHNSITNTGLKWPSSVSSGYYSSRPLKEVLDNE